MSFFYVFEAGYLTLRLEDRLRVFENRGPMKILWLKTDEVTVEWRTLHNEELCDLYCPPNIIWVTKTGRM